MCPAPKNFELVLPAEAGAHRRTSNLRSQRLRGWAVLPVCGLFLALGLILIAVGSSDPNSAGGWGGSRLKAALGQKEFQLGFQKASKVPSSASVARNAIRNKNLLRDVSGAEAREELEAWGFRPPPAGQPMDKSQHAHDSGSRSEHQAGPSKVVFAEAKQAKGGSTAMIREDMEGLADAVKVVADRLKTDEKELAYSVQHKAADQVNTVRRGGRNADSPPEQEMSRGVNSRPLDDERGNTELGGPERVPSAYMETVYGGWHHPRPYRAGNINDITYADTTSHTPQAGEEPVLKAAYPPTRYEYRGPAIIAESDRTQRLAAQARARMNNRGQSYFRDVFASREA